MPFAQTTIARKPVPRKALQPIETLQVDDALLKIGTVVAVTGLSESSIRRAVAAGDFPAPVKRGVRCTRWPALPVRQWLAAQGSRA